MTTPTLENWLEVELQKDRGDQGAKSEPLSLLTIVIPCYGRQDFLLRQCVYWHGSGANVVIVDGSTHPLGETVKSTLTGLNDILYIHSPTSLMERLKLACTHIHTPYAVLLGDDEFLLFSGLCSAITELEGDPSLAACIAQSIAFHPSRRGGPCTYGYGYPHWRYAVMQDDVQQRLEAAMSEYTAATCYAVLRTPIWRKSWGRLENWSSPYVGEMQQGLTTYIWGKLITVDEVYWMRSNENRPVTSKDFNRGLSFREWWLSQKFASEQDRFMLILASELESAKGFSHEQSRRVVRESIEVFIRHLNDLDESAERSLTRGRAMAMAIRRKFVKILKRVLPDAAVARIKSGMFVSASAPHMGNLGTLEDLKRTRTDIKFHANDQLIAELSSMEKLVNDFYMARKGRIE